jgi:hypothetical protein
MSRAHPKEAQPWLRYLVLPFVLILFGLVVSYALLAQQKQTVAPSIPSAPSPTPTPTPASSKYLCPSSGWINCMPILTKDAEKLCTTEAIAWYRQNCPGFKGIAY